MMRLALLLAAAFFVNACTGTEVTRGGGEAIAAVRALDESARPRIVVLPVLDRTPPYGARSLDLSLVLVNLYRPVNEVVQPSQFLGGVRDMLITDLFASQAFIVLERGQLSSLISEQAFAESPRFDVSTLAANKSLEGAQFLVAAAVTAFDTGSEGGALPIPIPAIANRDVAALGVLNLGFKKAYVSMDLRVLDAKTGRVLHTVAVEGGNTRFGVDLAAIAATRGLGVTQVPDLIHAFKNTPIESALQKMSLAAVEEIAKGFVGTTTKQSR